MRVIDTVYAKAGLKTAGIVSIPGRMLGDAFKATRKGRMGRMGRMGRIGQITSKGPYSFAAPGSGSPMRRWISSRIRERGTVLSMVAGDFLLNGLAHGRPGPKTMPGEKHEGDVGLKRTELVKFKTKPVAFLDLGVEDDQVGASARAIFEGFARVWRAVETR